LNKHNFGIDGQNFRRRSAAEHEMSRWDREFIISAFQMGQFVLQVQESSPTTQGLEGNGQMGWNHAIM
jgi:hypothetical protein